MKEEKLKDPDLNTFENKIEEIFSKEMYKYNDISVGMIICFLLIWIFEGFYFYYYYFYMKNTFSQIDSHNALLLITYFPFFFGAIVYYYIRYYHKKKSITKVFNALTAYEIFLLFLIMGLIVFPVVWFLKGDSPTISDLENESNFFILMLLTLQSILTLNTIFSFNKRGQFLYQLNRIQYNLIPQTFTEILFKTKIKKPFKILKLINSLNSLLHEIDLRILNQDELKNKILRIFFNHINKLDIFNLKNQKLKTILDTFRQRIPIVFLNYLVEGQKLKNITSEKWFNLYSKWISKQDNEITENSKDDETKENNLPIELTLNEKKDFYQLIFLKAPFYFFLNIYSQTNGEISHLTILNYFLNSLKFNVKLSSDFTIIKKISNYYNFIYKPLAIISTLITVFILFNSLFHFI